MRSRVNAAALACALLVSVAPTRQVGAAGLIINEADAADQDADNKSGKPASKEAEPGTREERKGARTGDDLESCRRDADGMRGPERSRFMTQCLRERK
ncbi:MAG: hypothetical protein JWO70_499 [Betaproteobacteria bacterium]|nr:hypothetical protein [Betaproteobacteria bacterium]